MAPLELTLLGITAAATSTAAIIGWLNYRARHKAYRYVAFCSRIGIDEPSADSSPVMRTLRIGALADHNLGSEWEITEISVASHRKKWLGKIDTTNLFGQKLRASSLKWKRRIRVDNPEPSIEVVLHDDAPEKLSSLVISLRVRLVDDERVVRRRKLRCSGIERVWK